MFGDLKTNSKGWKCHKLGDLGSFKTGGTPSSKHEEYYQGTIPFISTPALGPNYIDDDAAKYHISEEAIENCATTLIPAGSLIIGTRINVGQSSINKIPMCTNQDIVSMMNIDENYDLLFLKHCLNQYIPYLDSQKKGATIKGITVELLKSIMIPEPPIEEQKKYVDFVEQVDKSKVVSEPSSKSRFIEMFGCMDLSAQKTEWVPIGKVGTILTGSTPKTNEPSYWDGNLKWIAPAELTSDSFIIEDTERKITEEGRRSCSLNLLEPGVVLLSSRAPIGKVAIVGSEMYCNQGFKNIRCGSNLNNVYLYVLLKNNTKYLNSLGRGATFKEISAKIVENIRIPVPPIESQNQFVEFFKQVDKSKYVTCMAKCWN